MLHLDVHTRITAASALRHPWITKLAGLSWIFPRKTAAYCAKEAYISANKSVFQKKSALFSSHETRARSTCTCTPTSLQHLPRTTFRHHTRGSLLNTFLQKSHTFRRQTPHCKGNPMCAVKKVCIRTKEPYLTNAPYRHLHAHRGWHPHISAKEPCILEKETYILISQMLHIDIYTRIAATRALRVCMSMWSICDMRI